MLKEKEQDFEVIDPPIELIDLQSAHVTQVTHKGQKGNWVVKKNITSERIHALPTHLSETQVFDILNFARKYELIAFNTGVAFQKSKQNSFLLEKIANQEKLLKEFADENVRLANILEQHLPKED